MQNNKIYPFERNEFYYGKLLTAEDFTSEQTYFNNKRRFMNVTTVGSGVVRGLNCCKADNESIILESGMAIDAYGREIVVPSTEMLDLNAIRGYSESKSNSLVMGIRYAETKSEKVSCVMTNDDQKERFNKNKEEYELFLCDEKLVKRPHQIKDEIVTTAIIYSDSDLTVRQITPRYGAKNTNMCVTVEIERTAHIRERLSLWYDISIPGYICSDSQEDTLKIEIENITLNYGQVYSKTYILKSVADGAAATFTVNSGTFMVEKPTGVFTIPMDLTFLISEAVEDIESIILRNYYSSSLDELTSDKTDIYLCKLDIIRSKDGYIIERVENVPYSQYVYSAEQLMTLRAIDHYYPKGESINKSQPDTNNKGTSGNEGFKPNRYFSCGIAEIYIGMGEKIKGSIFSDEIMHGLGSGPVYIDVGFEYADEQPSGVRNSEVILGDQSVFDSGDDDEKIYGVTTAVKLMPDRGTFIIGMRLHEPTRLISVKLRWFAFKFPQTETQLSTLSNSADKCIIITPDTVIVQPKGTVQISPVFVNMPSEPCAYKVIDEGGGTIDQNGMYTAPSREGVFEVRVEALSDSGVYANAFVFVKDKI